MGDEYRRFRVTSSTALERERLLAEAFEAGASGAEESEPSEETGGEAVFCACIYAPQEHVGIVRDAVLRAASKQTRVDGEESLPNIDWGQAWKEGLEALRVSERLVVRPPFVEWLLEPGQCEVVKW